MSPNLPIPLKGLVVDDNADVRALAGAVLIQEGYTVFAAGNAAEALRIARMPSCQLDFLLTDFEMGTVNGLEVADAVRRLFPSIRVLMMSGSHIERIAAAGRVDAFLAKPFTPTALRVKLRQVLTEGATVRPGARAR